MKKQVITAALLGLTAAAGAAHAETRDGWYGGGTVGRSMQKIGSSGLDSAFGAQGLVSSSTMDSSGKTSYSLFVGNRLNEFFAVEGGYVNLGRFGYTSAVTLPAADTVSGHFQARGIDFAALGYFPISRRFSAYLKFGMAYLDARLDASSTGAVTVDGGHKRNLNPLFGTGISYDITRNISLRAGWDRFLNVGGPSTGKGAIDQFAGGITVHF
jgi:OOP family OmpA-OmpF porin